MSGYTRQSAGAMVTGSVMTAVIFNQEFNQLAAAFDSVTGHTHTGGVGDSAKIPLTTSVQGVLPIANGGTNATTAAAARTALGAQEVLTITPYAKTLIAAGNASSARNVLGVLNVQAFGVTTGTGGAYLLTLPVPQATVSGLAINVQFHTANLASPTLKVDAGLAYGIVHANGFALRANEILLNRVYTVMFDASLSLWVIQNLPDAEIGGAVYTGFIVNGLLDTPFIAPFDMVITSIDVQVAELTVSVSFETAAGVAYAFNTGQTVIAASTTQALLIPDTAIVMAKYQRMKFRFANTVTGARDFTAIFYGRRT